jgi:hypothetical protein
MMRTFPLLLIALTLVFSGCMSTGEVFAVVPVVGGETLRVPVSGPGVHNEKTDDLQLVAAQLEPKAGTPTIELRCEFKLLKPAVIRHVTVEDVAGERAVMFVDDSAPKLDGMTWKGTSTPITKDDARTTWLQSIENSIRVYRFTVETADGRKLVLNQPALFPAFVKMQIRHVFGMNY